MWFERGVKEAIFVIVKIKTTQTHLGLLITVRFQFKKKTKTDQSWCKQNNIWDYGSPDPSPQKWAEFK